MLIWKFTKSSIFSCLSPNLYKTEFISCTYCILWTLFLYIKRKGNFNIYHILWKCQQGRYHSRIDISPNKSLGTPVNGQRLQQLFFWQSERICYEMSFFSAFLQFGFILCVYYWCACRSQSLFDDRKHSCYEIYIQWRAVPGIHF